MASSAVLSQTLSSITSIKLDQLRKQKGEYETKKHCLLWDVAALGDDPDNNNNNTARIKRAKFLVDRTGQMPSMVRNPMISTKNISRFVEQARYDPSVSDALLRDYEESLRNELQVQSNRYEFATLYGKLVNEWITVGKGADERDDDDGGSKCDGEGGDGFVKVGREEMHEQRATWEEYVFKAKETDGEAIQAYLTGVFKEPSKDVKRATEALLKNMEQFQKDWEEERHFYASDLEGCLRGLLRADVLNDEKRSTVRDFLGNTVVLEEIADVLNMRMAARSSWTWDEPSVIEQRRNLNGRYRFYLDEDLLHTIFIYYIGRRWAVKLREELVKLVQAEGVWKSDSKPISKEAARRRRYFLGANHDQKNKNNKNTVHQNRLGHFNDSIMLDQLPTAMDEVRGSYHDEDYTKPADTRQTHTDVAQQLLHRIESEVLLQTRAMGRDVTVIRSDFKWFGPSIPHASIFAVLDFLGVNTEWRDFFRRVLEAPLRFKDEADVRTRKRGTPLSTPIADFFGESLLFCLDLAVNQKADGVWLYRLHDDMWLFGEVSQCARAWGVVSEFAAVVGLDFNLDKTGSVQISSSSRRNSSSSPAATTNDKLQLPQGNVKWGFLKLCPTTGRFVLNTSEVAAHVAELRRQLAACRSVLDWVQAWNLYGARFFARNLGQPAHCFSRAHIDGVLGVFRDIQAALFGGDGGGGGAAEHLKKMIAVFTGFPEDKIPTGYLYYPASLGGLGLQNPFIPLLLVRDLVVEDPEKEIVREFLDKEEAAYRRARERFENELSLSVAPRRARETRRGGEDDFADLADEPFFSLEEYTRYREQTSAEMHEAYVKLMERPDENAAEDIETAGDVKVAMYGGNHYCFTSYERWVVQLYHGDMVRQFGGLKIVDRELLPTGLIGMLRTSRFKWQG